MIQPRALIYCAGGGFGDSLMASIVARALRERYHAVDTLTLPDHRDALLRVPDLDEILVDDGCAESELARGLRARGYAACIVTWATPRTARVAQLAAIPIRVGQARRLYSWRFTHQVPVRTENGDVTTHWSQVLLDYARVLGCDTEDTTPRFVPTSGDGQEADAALVSHGLRPGNFAIVHPANAVATQRGIWPIEGWIRLARAVNDRFAVPVAITGGAADWAIAEAICAQADSISLAGSLSIGGFGALCSAAQFFAGITTGSMHVAAATGCPTIGIFPFQTDVPERWRPLGKSTAVVRASFPCRPGERKETCPDYACIAHLDVDRIVATIESLVAADNAGARA